MLQSEVKIFIRITHQWIEKLLVCWWSPIDTFPQPRYAFAIVQIHIAFPFQKIWFEQQARKITFPASRQCGDYSPTLMGMRYSLSLRVTLALLTCVPVLLVRIKIRRIVHSTLFLTIESLSPHRMSVVIRTISLRYCLNGILASNIHRKPEINAGSRSISWVLRSWRREEPGHQPPWYWIRWIGIVRSPHVKGCSNYICHFSTSSLWSF